MINEEIMDNLVEQYKEDFKDRIWPNEKFKWQAVKCFQDNWNINSNDFVDMLKKSFEKSGQLLASNKFYPAATIINLASKDCDSVKEMFISLFDEEVDFLDRIALFKKKADQLLEAFPVVGKSHFQNENSIITYLWLRFPDKYYIYKYSEVKAVA